MFIMTGGCWLVLLSELISSDHYCDDTTSGLFIHSLICQSDYPPSLLASPLLGCPGLGALPELDPGGGALQILQPPHHSPARKLSIDFSHQYNMPTFREFTTQPGDNDHHQVYRQHRGLPLRHHHHEEEERFQRPLGC